MAEGSDHHHHTHKDTKVNHQHSHPMRRHGGFGCRCAHGRHEDTAHEHGDGLEGWDVVGRRYIPVHTEQVAEREMIQAQQPVVNEEGS